MTIQWYPGHMHKAQKEIKKSLPKVDLVIEVLDARIPFSSENPLIAKLRDDKPCIKVLMKSDLADSEIVSQWQDFFEQARNVKTLALTIKNTSKIRGLTGLSQKLLPQRASGVKKLRAMIVGIPNVGKSTLINTLAGKAIAKTGNEPAVTKSQQFVQISEDFLLLDTPGILWPKQEYPKSSYRLAVTGAVKDTAMDYDDVAFFAAEYLLKAYPERLVERYNLSNLPQSELELIEAVGARRGCLGAGGRIDLTRASERFIHDLRSAAIGELCLETPAMVQQELEDHAAALEEKRLANESKKNQKAK